MSTPNNMLAIALLAVVLGLAVIGFLLFGIRFLMRRNDEKGGQVAKARIASLFARGGSQVYEKPTFELTKVEVVSNAPAALVETSACSLPMEGGGSHRDAGELERRRSEDGWRSKRWSRKHRHTRESSSSAATTLCDHRSSFSSEGTAIGRTSPDPRSPSPAVSGRLSPDPRSISSASTSSNASQSPPSTRRRSLESVLKTLSERIPPVPSLPDEATRQLLMKASEQLRIRHKEQAFDHALHGLSKEVPHGYPQRLKSSSSFLRKEKGSGSVSIGKDRKQQGIEATPVTQTAALGVPSPGVAGTRKSPANKPLKRPTSTGSLEEDNRPLIYKIQMGNSAGAPDSQNTRSNHDRLSVGAAYGSTPASGHPYYGYPISSPQSQPTGYYRPIQYSMPSPSPGMYSHFQQSQQPAPHHEWYLQAYYQHYQMYFPHFAVPYNGVEDPKNSRRSSNASKVSIDAASYYAPHQVSPKSPEVLAKETAHPPSPPQRGSGKGAALSKRNSITRTYGRLRGNRLGGSTTSTACSSTSELEGSSTSSGSASSIGSPIRGGIGSPVGGLRTQ
ncbi:hypothetical protein HDU67_001998 [Dinochytrium kinnereticum]|nr:hypothetical protein HDU67_001998 [Dinochytrium kinnereticum]